MNTNQREQVRANAKYLREVRPIDPEEIFEYVDGQPHPAVVREVLRDAAPDLGLIERADGTFVPPADVPIEIEFEGVSEFPEGHARALENLLVEQYGPGWPDGDSGARLRDLISRFKESYFAGTAVEYDSDTALAYALYHLPDYYAVAQYVLADLAREGLCSHHLRVLDVGAGVGGPALGLADLLPEDALCEYHAIEPSSAAEVLDSLLESTGRNFHPTIDRTTAEDFELDGEYDLILFANSLSELDDPVETARWYFDALAPTGSPVGIAPADRETSIGLRQVERALCDSGPATRYGPTVRLWPGHSPTDRGWSFDVEPDFAVPGFQRRLAETVEDPDADPEAFVNVDVQFSHTVLRKDETRRVEFHAEPRQNGEDGPERAPRLEPRGPPSGETQPLALRRKPAVQGQRR